MTRQATTAGTSGGRGSAAELRGELLERLGLRPDANDQEIETAHRDLTDFLADAPESLGDWAEHQLERTDEAFALLSGPAAGLQAAARERYAAAVQARVAARPGAVADAPRDGVGNRLPWALLAALAIVGVVVGVWWLGRPATSVPAMTSADQSSSQGQPSAAPSMDQAKLAGLMQKVAANPKDTASLQGIADLYFTVGDYKNAAVFADKVLAVDPKNQIALLSVGAAQFNAGDSTAAEKTWLKAAELYPTNQEVHYDLGFLYMTLKQTEKMNAQWQQVMAIDPNSELAKTVSSHLGKGTGSAGTSATPTPSTSATK